MMNAIISISAPGGEDSLFTRYSRFFDRLDLGNLLLWDGDAADQLPNGVPGCETWFTHQARIVCQFAEHLNTTEDWIREDYQEMNELLIKFFRVTVSIILAPVFIYAMVVQTQSN